MDFTTSEETNDLGGLVRDITESVCTPAHHKELDKLDERFDRTLWGKLVDADVLSAAAPEALGGGGFGVLEQTAILTALGRQLAAVPYLESVVLAAGALAKFGSQALQDEWGTPAVKGEQILTVALDGETGPGTRAGSVQRSRLPADGVTGPGRLRPRRRRLPGTRRNRLRGARFSSSPPAMPGCLSPRWTRPGTAACPTSTCRASRSAPNA